MNSINDFTNFCKRLEGFIHVFQSGDPDPLSFMHKKQLNAWKALLNNELTGKSKTQIHVREVARNFASKIRKVAGNETLFLTVLIYAISRVPKITYETFYADLTKWSESTHFPKSLHDQASSLWNEPGNRPSVQQEANNHRLSSRTTAQTTGDAHLRNPTTTNEEIESRIAPNKPLEIAFLVPPDSLDAFYKLHKDSLASQQHSAILTIPTQDRVASLVLSIPRTEAVSQGDRFGLPMIFNSESPSV
ncbi:hypothetical protein TSTA_108350 [Talaromyces stipitatus ATCC 10500]|uniref:Uncharacterized protein n=1 Tax=Talaromyces stipitatus (strain ATCC 10500 / CBS 375.48 / QM 6759 / NRRL 1006) TaxID=441959 RepID=B8MUE3_TALSN|nr:uncharacterized protein TSTA_108350 [Talaromyces stipitatus ATCC 10500]XP_002488404.1 uncharacterized protein TSTA_108350 [Talaromyces stipitatus ATCC 10500]EED11647.1 hypothetical protein TSTA_108350 [Talaromyces stipitatus ATCC 10500]EED11648.1 hypothetical protein TSTA_108350 [Talaromyces stipitatus ATCC 10500]